MYDLFFELEDNLCQRYSGLTPFAVRREKVGEVFLLVRRINARKWREKGYKPNDKVYIDSKGNKHIRRKAMNDDWY